MTEPIRGRWFDGRASVARPVLVSLQAAADGPGLRLHEITAGGRMLELRSRQVGWPERWSATRAPRTLTIDLREHGTLEIEDVPAWQAALAAAGDRPALTQRMQTRWSTFAGVLMVAALALGAFYRWGTPWAATQVTRQVPLDWELALSQRALQDMDRRALQPSKLAVERQAQLKARFNTLAARVDKGLQRYPGYTPPLSLQFRSGMPANAFALPGGTIVMTDALVQEALKQGLGDEALVGVLAHEIGHVMHRHTTRMVVEQAVLNVGLGLVLGDVSSLVSIGGSLLTGLAYRRNHETEADCFAAALMQKAQLPTGPMADLLLGLEHAHADKAFSASSSTLATMLSSHPATEQRAQQLKQGRLQGC